MKEIVFINEIVINDVYNLYSNRPCLISINFQFSVVGTKMFYKILVILFTCIIYNVSCLQNVSAKPPGALRAMANGTIT